MCQAGKFLKGDQYFKECRKRAPITPDARALQWYKPRGKMRVRCGQKRFYMQCLWETGVGPVWEYMGGRW